MVDTALRVIFALAVVIGLLLILNRVMQGRFKTGGKGAIRLIHRQSVGRTSSVALIAVGSRVMVVGATEQNVSLLTELDPEELDMEVVSIAAPAVQPVEGEDGAASPQRFVPQGPVGGSILDPQVWKQAWAIFRKRGR